MRRIPRAVPVSVLTLVLGLAWGCAASPSKSPGPPPTQAPTAEAALLDPQPTEHPPRVRFMDVTHYTIRLAVDDAARTLKGTVEVTFTPLNPSFQSVDLDSEELTISAARLESVTLGAGPDGKPDPRQAKIRPAHTAPFKVEKTFVRIDLSEDARAIGRMFRPGDTLTVAVDYEKKDPRKGMFFVAPEPSLPDRPHMIWTQGEAEDTHFWVPCYDYPNERAASEMILTVPEPYLAISNGRLVEMTPHPESHTRTWHFKEEVPHVAYLLTVVAGDFREFKDTWKDIPVLYYVPPAFADEGTIKRSFERTPDMLTFFSDRIGTPYPWEKYAQSAVYDFIYGGMENASATTLTHTTLHDERSQGDVESEGLVAHELAHQWWGDLLTCNDWSHIWLNEGFATYFESLYREHWRGVDEFRDDLRGSAGWYKGEDAGEYKRPVVTTKYIDPDDLFDGHTYAKGAWVLHMLRFALGDETWWKGIQLYCKRHARQTVVTADLQHAMEEVSKQELGWFFDEWLYKTHYPEFKVDWKWDKDHNQATLHVVQAQEVKDLTPHYKMPVAVQFADAQKKADFRITVEGREQWFSFALDFKPAMCRFDKGGWILKSLEFPKEKEELLFQLKNDDDVIGRYEALDGLEKIAGDEAVVAAIREALLNDGFYGVKRQAAESLTHFARKDPKDLDKPDKTADAARDALLEAVADKDSRVRQSVISALGRWREDKIVEALKKAAAEESSYHVRARAIGSLTQAAPRNAFETLRTGLAQPSQGEVIRGEVFRGLADSSETRGLEILWNWVQRGNPDEARSAAIGPLLDLGKGNPAVLDLLIQLLEDPSFRFRGRIMGALGQLGDPKALEPLKKHAETEFDYRHRKSAREAIKAIEKKQPAWKVKEMTERVEGVRKDILNREKDAKTRALDLEKVRLDLRRLEMDLERLKDETEKK